MRALAALFVTSWSVVAAANPPRPLLAPEGGSGSAPYRSIAVLILSGEEVGVAMSELYNAARSSIEAETALDVAALDVFSPAVRADAIRACAGSGKCFAEKLRASGTNVDLLLTVSITDVGDAVLLGLRLVSTRTDEDLSTVGEELPSGVSPVRAIRDFVSKAFPTTIWGQKAALTVEADQPNTEVIVGNQPCVSPCRFDRMIPGNYSITARRAGYKDWHGQVALVARATETITIAMEEEERSLLANPWLWTGIGVGVAAAAGTTVALLVMNAEAPKDVCIARSIDLCQR